MRASISRCAGNDKPTARLADKLKMLLPIVYAKVFVYLGIPAIVDIAYMLRVYYNAVCHLHGFFSSGRAFTWKARRRSVPMPLFPWLQLDSPLG